MKRYVKEFANDILMTNHPRVKSGELRHPGRNEIISTLIHYERGRITAKEAVRAIMEIDAKCEGQVWNIA